MTILSESMLTRVAVALSAFAVLAGGLLACSHPDRPWPYLLAIGIVGVAWLVRYLAVSDAEPSAARRRSTQAIVFAAAPLAVALGIKLLPQLGVSDGVAADFGERSFGVVMGLIVLLLGSAIPKQVRTAGGVASARIAGWALTLGGVGYMLAWLLLPLAYADDAAMLLLLSGTICGAVGVVRLCLQPRPLPPTSG